MSGKTEIKQLVAWLALFGAMPFLSCHIFFFAIHYYNNALEIPILLVLPLVWLCCLRVMSYAPVTKARSARILRTPFVRRSALSVCAAVEATIWYALIASGYAMLHRWFDFPKSVEGYGILPILGGYLAFFVGSLLGMGIILSITRGLHGVWRELAATRILRLRLVSTLLAYLTVTLLFAAVYRLLSLHTSAAFSAPLNSAVDAIYFSTVPITTLGYGDISPRSSLAKVFTAVEALAGIFLLAVLIGLVINVSIEERKPHNKTDAGDAK
ncbi:hypothetical protein LCGC14_1815960 [marine sediment metagenome]|uniref:Potassium channel domain-containing protein n=1 Tax=marine sediment metagenome TaxID=412755 RepID=A0A0F9JK12_9ZZZZ